MRIAAMLVAVSMLGGAVLAGEAEPTEGSWRRLSPAGWEGRALADGKSVFQGAWLEEMASFEYLDSDGLLSRTELAGGTAILVNRGPEPAEADGRVIPARAFEAVH